MATDSEMLEVIDVTRTAAWSVGGFLPLAAVAAVPVNYASVHIYKYSAKWCLDAQTHAPGALGGEQSKCI